MREELTTHAPFCVARHKEAIALPEKGICVRWQRIRCRCYHFIELPFAAPDLRVTVSQEITINGLVPTILPMLLLSRWSTAFDAAPLVFSAYTQFKTVFSMIFPTWKWPKAFALKFAALKISRGLARRNRGRTGFPRGGVADKEPTPIYSTTRNFTLHC